MSYTIAIAGKGGTGKTTIAALTVRLLKENKAGSILAVDADPNNNLAEALGIETKETIGSIIDDVSRHLDKIPAGMSKDRFIEYRVQTSVAEGEGFDVLSMGRPEGPGCYCYVNNILRNIVGKLIADYDYIVIDNEAGFEHLSRRTTRACDTLIVVSDDTAVGLKAAKRISDLIEELEIKAKKSLLVINHCDKKIEAEKIKKTGLDYIGNMPEDPQVEKISLNGASLMALKNDAPSLSALRKLGEKIWS
ncbi:MAG: AAA family ATPase [Candidatus Omnitrophica bacterium]|nr:AAA family ATPase [Candidatus Omnitrophota bacterium]MDD5592589.1 AAA family ATPase [Candidatus Omnitrophota bacterium]